MMQQHLDNLVFWIEDHSSKIIGNIEQESIDVYNFLKQQFYTTDVTKNYVFQFTYRSFYRLDNGGLSPQLKTEYFKILEENRDAIELDFNSVLQRLFLIPNRKGQHTFQFSFVTKMFNTINDSIPIYDSEVARAFSFPSSYQRGFEKKIIKHLEKFQQIQKAYKYILDAGLLSKTFNSFDENFKDNHLSEIKKLDFIFWSAGKIKKLLQI